MKISWKWSLWLVGLLLLGCSGADTKGPIREMEFEPIYITYQKKGTTVHFENMDNDQAFRKAGQHFKEGQYREARKLFLMVARNAKAPLARWLAWFNAGACSMSLDDYGAARDQFGMALQAEVEPVEKNAARAMLGKAEAKRGRWDVALGHFDKVLAQPYLEGENRAEVCLWAGRGELGAGNLHKAELRLSEAEESILDSVPLKQQQGLASLAQVYFYRGQVQRFFARTIKMRLPQERMAVDLEARRSLFWQAERFYSLGVRIRHPLWSVRSGYALGEMAEEFAGDILDAEIPPEMNADERKEYFREIGPHVFGVLVEARDYFKRTTQLADRMGFKNEWVEKAREKVGKLNARLDALRVEMEKAPKK